MQDHKLHKELTKGEFSIQLTHRILTNLNDHLQSGPLLCAALARIGTSGSK